MKCIFKLNIHIQLFFLYQLQLLLFILNQKFASIAQRLQANSFYLMHFLHLIPNKTHFFNF